MSDFPDTPAEEPTAAEDASGGGAASGGETASDGEAASGGETASGGEAASSGEAGPGAETGPGGGAASSGETGPGGGAGRTPGGRDPAAGRRLPRAAGDGARFPPDEVLDLPAGLTFVRVLTVVAVVGALVDLATAGLPGEPFPYSYPFPVALVHVLAALWLLPRVHAAFVAVRDELVHLAGQKTLVGGESAEAPTPAAIRAEIDRTLDRWFHPAVLLGGALVAGPVGVGIVHGLDLTGAYPHRLTAFAFLASHGLFFGPLLGGLALVRRAANEYIVDVDVLAPDGMGGYRAIGDALVSLLVYAVVLVTLNSVMLLSALDLPGRGPFEVVAAGLYGLMLVTFVGLLLVSVVAIRNRLLVVRDRKVDDLREEFEAVEATYWEKLEAGEDNTVEAENLRTMRAMFVELNRMSLWPLNLYSVFKAVGGVLASLVTSLLVFAIRNPDRLAELLPV